MAQSDGPYVPPLQIVKAHTLLHAAHFHSAHFTSLEEGSAAEGSAEGGAAAPAAAGGAAAPGGGNDVATMNPTFCAMAHPGGDVSACAPTDTVDVRSSVPALPRKRDLV